MAVLPPCRTCPRLRDPFPFPLVAGFLALSGTSFLYTTRIYLRHVSLAFTGSPDLRHVSLRNPLSPKGPESYPLQDCVINTRLSRKLLWFHFYRRLSALSLTIRVVLSKIPIFLMPTSSNLFDSCVSGLRFRSRCRRGV